MHRGAIHRRVYLVLKWDVCYAFNRTNCAGGRSGSIDVEKCRYFCATVSLVWQTESNRFFVFFYMIKRKTKEINFACVGRWRQVQISSISTLFVCSSCTSLTFWVFLSLSLFLSFFLLFLLHNSSKFVWIRYINDKKKTCDEVTAAECVGCYGTTECVIVFRA